MNQEYRVVIYNESALASIFLPGGAKIKPDRFGEFLNRHAAEGWRVVTMDRESRRTAIFFSREAFVVILERTINAHSTGAAAQTSSIPQAQTAPTQVPGYTP